ncbi:hypothetical protein [Aeromonas veronii]|uniref:hypothetical protein n=1 Tax=Aeromonas veronii TaxID=654 RepID=UPI000E09DC71|nr:hypothetical protein [Aeromonas veronii]RDE60943.1 hypothetical protein DV708_16715 [Aeromonas veronii]
MAKERKMLVASIIFAVVGWLTVAVLVMLVGESQEREASAKSDAAAWKRQAGKAYTELLKATTGTTNGSFIVPAGARIECAMKEENGKAKVDCGEGTIFPAKDY